MTIKARAIGVAAALLALSGCLSLGGKMPAQLLNLTATSSAPAGSAANGTSATALAVLDIQAPLELDVTRVPVSINGSSVAYVKDAQWVDKPTRLFGRLLSDTIRAKGNRLVVTGSNLEDAAANKLSGTLSAMNYDASHGAVVVRFDAVFQNGAKQIQTKRFESVVPGVSPQAGSVGDALNRAANDVAAQVAAWVG
ncbi:MAG TPA: ABC-type transport auxiliary lipoprotein family protein [Croceibacterium sp.]|nr:ABC-type transport auxiliary lipoprotein family protein [Croceibacterium sp.]